VGKEGKVNGYGLSFGGIENVLLSNIADDGITLSMH
jgi:hypothetical protein